jgi:hypothetical protein
MHHPKKVATPRPVRPGKATSLIHTQARFLYAGKVLASVDNASAVLYDSTAAKDDVYAITSGGEGIVQAERVCGAFVPGVPQTVGPGGDVYFDYVDSGDYWILVCARVKFSGMAKPVWVSGTIPITRQEFTEKNETLYDVPRQVQIVLDPYAKELNATPMELSVNEPEKPPPFDLAVMARRSR